MMRKIPAAVSALVLLATMTGTASADGVDAGVGTGTLTVGKQRDECREDGTSNVTGAGLGLPIVNPPKEAVYAMAVTTASPAHGFGTIAICGDIAGVEGIGAACSIFKGYAGRGRYTTTGSAHPLPPVHSGDVVSLHDVGWKTVVGHTPVSGGTIPMTGSYENDGEQGTFLGLFEIQGGLPCLTKSDKGESSGASLFTMAGEFALVPNPPQD
jgi:hypothetical protein